MKKSLIALAVLSATGASFAQTSVNVYGIADAYFGSTRTTGLPTQNVINSGSSVNESRFGFKGTEDLGGGLKANFLLEQGFSMDSGASSATGTSFASISAMNTAVDAAVDATMKAATIPAAYRDELKSSFAKAVLTSGSADMFAARLVAAMNRLAAVPGLSAADIAALKAAAGSIANDPSVFFKDKTSAESGQMFSRQAYVGFSGGFGEVKLGKMFTPYDDISGSANAVFDSGLSPQKGVWLSNDNNFLYAANPGNSIYYATPNISGFSGALSYSLGENKTATVDAGTVTSLSVQYADGPLYAGFAHQTEKFTGSDESLQFSRLNATYDLGVVTVLAGYGRFTVQDAETHEWQVGIDYPVSSTLKLSGGIARSSDNADMGDSKRSGYGLGAAYSLSKRTMIYGGYRSSTLETPNIADIDNSLLAVGINHKF